MFILVRKILVYSAKDASYMHKSRLPFSVYFSTYRGNEKGVTNPTISELLIQKHNLFHSPQLASRIASVVNHLKTPENPDSVISFFKENGFSDSQLNRIIESRPNLLTANLVKTIQPRFSTFKKLGFSDSQIAEIISKNPWILRYSLKNRVIPSLSMLSDLLGSIEEVAKLLSISDWFFTKDMEKTLKPNIETLVNHGVPKKEIIKMLCISPRFLLVSPGVLSRHVEKVEELGFRTRPKVFLSAVRVLVQMSKETWELKLESLRTLGFSEGDIMDMFKRQPLVFSASVEKIKEIKKIVLATGKYELSCICSCPKALTSSIEKRYKPRLKVLEILESRKLIEKWPSIGKVSMDTDEKFRKEFVDPYFNKVGDQDKRVFKRFMT